MRPNCARLVLACLAVTVALTPGLAAQQPEGDQEEAAIRRVVDSHMQPFLTQHQIPGAIVGISIHGRRYFYPYGTATGAGAPFTANTLVEIGSCTKVFTTTLFALGVTRGQIAPDDSAQKFMPEGLTLRPLAQKVTPLRLADFSSGVPDNPTNLPRRLAMRGIEHYTVNDFLRWVSNWQPSAPPPAPYRYSNAGIGLLGYLVSEATGKPWEEQFSDEILRPLGMTDTALRPSPEQKQRAAWGHTRNSGVAPPWPVFAWYAAGGLRSTALDMLRFGEANLGHPRIDGQPVSEELIAAMRLAQRPIYDLPSGKARQGMAWVTNLGDEQAGMRPEVLKNGGTAGFGTVILVNHSKDIALFIAVNEAGHNPAPIGVAIGAICRNRDHDPAT